MGLLRLAHPAGFGRVELSQDYESIAQWRCCIPLSYLATSCVKPLGSTRDPFEVSHGCGEGKIVHNRHQGTGLRVHTAATSECNWTPLPVRFGSRVAPSMLPQPQRRIEPEAASASSQPRSRLQGSLDSSDMGLILRAGHGSPHLALHREGSSSPKPVTRSNCPLDIRRILLKSSVRLQYAGTPGTKRLVRPNRIAMTSPTALRALATQRPSDAARPTDGSLACL
jgi:hypothetical protein